MADLPLDYRDLLEGTAIATVATILPDGSPHQTVTWIDTDGRDVLINTAEGRQKVRNVRRDPQVSVLVVDPEDPERYLSVQGSVVAIETEGAAAHANALGRRYNGVEDFMARYGDDVVRVILRISPTHVIAH